MRVLAFTWAGGTEVALGAGLAFALSGQIDLPDSPASGILLYSAFFTGVAVSGISLVGLFVNAGVRGRHRRYGSGRPSRAEAGLSRTGFMLRF